MAISKKRIYELTNEQTTIVDTDLGMLDKSGYDKAKKFTMLNLYNYVKSKFDSVYQALLVSGTNIKTINGSSILGSGDLTISASDYTYTEVVVSASELQNIGTTPKQILPALVGNKYYDYYGFVEYTYNGVSYDAFDNLCIGEQDNYSCTILDVSLLVATVNSVVKFNTTLLNALVGVDTQIASIRQAMPKAIKLFMYNNTDSTVGNGTILVKIWHREITFGSEL